MIIRTRPTASPTTRPQKAPWEKEAERKGHCMLLLVQVFPSLLFFFFFNFQLFLRLRPFMPDRNSHWCASKEDVFSQKSSPALEHGTGREQTKQESLPSNMPPTRLGHIIPTLQNNFAFCAFKWDCQEEPLAVASWKQDTYTRDWAEIH